MLSPLSIASGVRFDIDLENSIHTYELASQLQKP